MHEIMEITSSPELYDKDKTSVSLSSYIELLVYLKGSFMSSSFNGLLLEAGKRTLNSFLSSWLRRTLNSPLKLYLSHCQLAKHPVLQLNNLPSYIVFRSTDKLM